MDQGVREIERPTLPFTLIGITGKAGTGKDTLCEMLCERYRAVRYAFADPIKAALNEMFGFQTGQWDDRVWKEQTQPWIGKSPRELVQTLGTEWGREMVHQEIWLKLADRFRMSVREGTAVIIPDVRFDNEALWLYSKGGAILNLVRPSAGSVAQHISEQGINQTWVTATIVNDGTKEELLDRAVASMTLGNHDALYKARPW